MKTCFKCGLALSLDQFYKHKQMADGHLNKCKACTKNDVAEHRKKNTEKIREYDRKRGNRQSYEYMKEHRRLFQNQHRAQSKVRREIRAGNLVKKPCEICGTSERINAHHDDYLEPLNIRWLCSAHHHQWHAKNGSGKNP